jgi:hypothetical protein
MGGKALKRLTTLILYTLFSATLIADPIPEGARFENMEVVGYIDAADSSPFKLTLYEHEGRWLMYTSNFFHRGWSIFDVTDPADPLTLKFIPGADNTSSWQIDLADDKLITSYDQLSRGWGGDPDRAHAEEAILIWSLDDPYNPEVIGRFITGGGTHRNGYPGGDLVHLASGLPGYNGDVYQVVDISDPSHPVEVGRFAPEGMAEGDEVPYDQARLHGPAQIRGDTAFLSFGGAGAIIADVSDYSNIREISRLDFGPLFGPTHLSVHTVLPYLERDLLLVNSEAINEECNEALNFAGLVDISDLSSPRLISNLPLPQPPEGEPLDYFCSKGGRFGPHNQNELQYNPLVKQQDDLLYLTYFNAGLRVYDISVARNPQEVGWFLPPDPTERRGPLPRGALVAQSEDVLVDTRGYIYVSHKNQGIWILRYTGE